MSKSQRTLLKVITAWPIVSEALPVMEALQVLTVGTSAIEEVPLVAGVDEEVIGHKTSITMEEDLLLSTMVLVSFSDKRLSYLRVDSVTHSYLGELALVNTAL